LAHAFYRVTTFGAIEETVAAFQEWIGVDADFARTIEMKIFSGRSWRRNGGWRMSGSDVTVAIENFIETAALVDRLVEVVTSWTMV
jgi:hypothetical protein